MQAEIGVGLGLGERGWEPRTAEGTDRQAWACSVGANMDACRQAKKKTTKRERFMRDVLIPLWDGFGKKNVGRDSRLPSLM